MLSPKQSAFVREYLVDLNASHAAQRAGYSKKTARSIGWELLRKPEVAEAMREAMSTRAERTEITADWVLRRLREEADKSEGDTTQSARVQALQLLGKHLGMFVDRQELTGRNGGPVEVVPAPTMSREEWLAAHGVKLVRHAPQ